MAAPIKKLTKNQETFLYGLYAVEHGDTAQFDVGMLQKPFVKKGTNQVVVSTAQGGFQFIEGTRDMILKKYNLDAWSNNPMEQQSAVLAYIKYLDNKNGTNAIDFINKGNYDAAAVEINKKGIVWEGLDNDIEFKRAINSGKTVSSLPVVNNYAQNLQAKQSFLSAKATQGGFTYTAGSGKQVPLTSTTVKNFTKGTVQQPKPSHLSSKDVRDAQKMAVEEGDTTALGKYREAITSSDLNTDENIVKLAIDETLKSMHHDKSAKSGEGSSGAFAEQYLSNVADALGYTSDSLTSEQREELNRYKLSGSRYVGKNITSGSRRDRREYLSSIGIGESGTLGGNSDLEKTIKEGGFLAGITNYSAGKWVAGVRNPGGVRELPESAFRKPDGTLYSEDEMVAKLAEAQKELETEQGRGAGATGKYQRVGALKGSISQIEEALKYFDKDTDKTATQATQPTQPTQATQPVATNKSGKSFPIGGSKSGSWHVNTPKLATSGLDLESLRVATSKGDATSTNNTEEPTSNTEESTSLLDNLGGWGTAIGAGVSLLAAKAASKPIERPDMPELSDAFKAYMHEQEQISKMGLSPAEEAQAKSMISESYAAGMENIRRGTGGDAAKYLSMTGSLDANRQKALLDLAAKDAQLKQANREKFGNLAMFKENFEQQRKMQMRNEEMQEIQNRYSTNAGLAAQAAKFTMENIASAKADKWQNLYFKKLAENIGGFDK